MRNLVLALAATAVISACSSPASPSSGPSPVSKTVISCNWGATCDQYGGAVDPTFATNLETTCKMVGTAYAQGPCPTANQVAGHCQLASAIGTTNDYYYYAPKYDAASAQTDCTGAVVGVKWVP